MRISNIKQYLGGADNVIARDIIEQDQFRFNFKIGTENLTNYTYEVDTQLFKAEVTTRGSNITIDSLVAQATDTAVDESTTITLADGAVSGGTVFGFDLSANNISLSTLIIPNGFEFKIVNNANVELTRVTGRFPINNEEYFFRISRWKTYSFSYITNSRWRYIYCNI